MEFRRRGGRPDNSFGDYRFDYPTDDHARRRRRGRFWGVLKWGVAATAFIGLGWWLLLPNSTVDSNALEISRNETPQRPFGGTEEGIKVPAIPSTKLPVEEAISVTATAHLFKTKKSPAKPSPTDDAHNSRPSSLSTNISQQIETSTRSTGSVVDASESVVDASEQQKRKAEAEAVSEKQQDDLIRQALLGGNTTQAESMENEGDSQARPTKDHSKRPSKKKPKSPRPEKLNAEDNTPVNVMPILPSSSVWCSGDTRATRVCRFRNICYHPTEQEWFIAQTNRTIQSNVPLHRFHTGLLELSTVQGHPKFFFNFIEVDPFRPEFQNMKVRYEETMHFALARLHPRNIMHNLHDDVLGMYYMLKEYIGKGSPTLNMPFSLDTHRILIYDEYGPTDSTRPFQYLSNHRLRFKAYLKQDKDVVTCFRDAVFGNSKLTTWYQYGFTEPQGPIPEKLPNGMHVREVSEWFIRRIGLPLEDDENYSRPSTDLTTYMPADAADFFTESDLIVIITRRGNRLILNEEELARQLTDAFKLQVQFVSNEEHGFEEQVKFMRRARVVLGMHGSMMIMTMFCRRGTAVIEMFPFGVPSENYTPYRTLASLPGMELSYRAWEQTDESQCVPRPENHKLLGGIAHLTKEKQAEVVATKRVPKHICCDNPFWLYRIYQDTNVNSTEVITLIEDALEESAEILSAARSINYEATDILPPLVTKIICLDGPKRLPGELWAEWKQPWTGAKVDKWNILIGGSKEEGGQREFVADGSKPIMAIKGFSPGQLVQFWIRPIVGDFKGEWGKRVECRV
ncbi:Protein O-linked-mannose beta-1,4-N-acetylglucosaminyltransferase 2 [Gaertneriomyces sp. JEL0708]|nr:Protein O-linked-mannose beta-1,4-N-acetylglucosaminyltransferase 2 [Gaertneriomyces sp. JEL0708]